MKPQKIPSPVEKETFPCLYCGKPIEVRPIELPPFRPGVMYEFSTLLDYKCPHCHKTFSYEAESRRYELSEKDHFVPVCPCCGDKKFGLSHDKIVEGSSFYSDTDKFPPSVFRYTCPKCGKSFYYDVIKKEVVEPHD